MKSKYETHVKPYIALVKSMRIDGAREEDIYKRLGIGHTAWNDYKNKHTVLTNALKISKETLVAKLEDTMYKQALNGNSTLLIFALKNLASHKWGDKIDVNASIKAGEFNEAIKRFIEKI